MAGDNVIKFGKAKKSLARSAKEKNARVNRARHGLKKSAKELKLAQTKKLQAKLDAHKIERATTPDVTSGAVTDDTSE